MGVSEHLGIDIVDFDAAIRTLIPRYDALLDAATEAIDALAARAPVVVDLGIGSGALAACVLTVRPRARLLGIDEDGGMLALAERRLGARLTTVRGNFERAALPRCDLVTASYALHHVRTRARKAALYRRVFRALRPGGLLVSGDNFLASSPRLRAADRTRWLAFLRREYGAAKAAAFLRAWAKEDVYFTLREELDLLEGAGFRTDVAWRQDSFAVVCGVRR